MAFRKRRRFRKRSPFDMQTGKLCRDLIEFAHGNTSATCATPVTNAVELVSPLNQNELSAKSLMWGGCHFQLEYTAPDVVMSGDLEGSILTVDIWSAIVVLPKLPGSFGGGPSGLPSFLPALSEPANVGDRDVDILWKRLDRLYIKDLGSAAVSPAATGLPIISDTFGKHEFTSELVRTRRNLREDQGLYLVTSIVDGIPAGIFNVAFISIQRAMWMRYAVMQAKR